MAGDSISETAAARRTPGKIHEDQFRLMWAEGATTGEIARFFGVRTPAVRSARKRLGLRADRKVPQPPTSPPAPSADSIAATQGSYAALAEFATRHGITMTQAQQQWHRHRAGA